ncbi:MAG: bifunctional diguanylate cyclase/phosphodiesterase [Janthinobacterium lividum]
MWRIVDCVRDGHDLRLLALSALICVLGCMTTTSLLTRAGEGLASAAWRWHAMAATVFGCSVWSLHFVAMLAFAPARGASYEIDDTVASILVAVVGAVAGLAAWRTTTPRFIGNAVGGTVVGLGIAGMHYLGISAMSETALLRFDGSLVVASIVASVAASTLALSRAYDLNTMARQVEVGLWLALAICGLHFTGMAAVTITPVAASGDGPALLGSTTLAVAVSCVSGVMLVAGLAAVTVERRMRHTAMRDLQRLRRMSNLAREVILVHRDGVVLEVNSAGERLRGAPADEIVGHPLTAMFSLAGAEAVTLRAQKPVQKRCAEEIEFQSVDGTLIPVEITCELVDYPGGPATATALLDLSVRRRDEAKVRHLARHDALTGLPNRHHLQERLESTIERAAREGTGLALVYVDLDRFKPVNDLHGHAIGDEVLRHVAKRLLGELAPGDTVARVGGDEFIILLPGDDAAGRAAAVAPRVVAAMCRPFRVDDQCIEIGASIGVAIHPTDGGDADALTRAADAAMYRVKEGGRGGLCFFEPSMNIRLQERLQTERELAQAMGNGELRLHYQPIVDAATGDIDTFEALLRWEHPTRGRVPPCDFIPIAEACGLIDGLGRWVIATACREAASWDYPWRVSINVSPRQFRQSNVCSTLAAALGDNDLDANRVIVEITEGVLVEDADKAVSIVRRLREMGVRVALDDFGTGFSSLSYLQLFKFDKLKIDKSFVRRLGEGEEALMIVRTIVNLGHNLGLQVTAEGVETKAQFDVLRTLGCDQIQGYLVAKPGPIAAYDETARKRTLALFETNRLRLLA